MLVCRLGHEILVAEDVQAAIANYPLILPSKGAVIATTVSRYLSSIGLPEMRGVFETVALPVGRKIVQASDMLWFISRGVVADELNNGALVTVDLASPLLSGPVGISVSSSAPLSVGRSMLADCLKASVTRSAS